MCVTNSSCFCSLSGSSGFLDVVHVHAIGEGTLERTSGHEILSRQPVSILSHIQGEVNVIHKLIGLPL